MALKENPQGYCVSALQLRNAYRLTTTDVIAAPVRSPL